MALLRRFAHWELTPILLAGLVNVLAWFHQTGECVWFSILISVAVIAGIGTPDGLVWFTALCLSIPALLAPGYHGRLIFSLLTPFTWFNFLVNFTPLYLAYAASVRFGMILRSTAAAFKAGYKE